MENIRQHYAKSGWPDVKEVREMPGKQLLGCSESNFIFSRENKGRFIHIWNKFYSVTYSPFCFTCQKMK